MESQLLELIKRYCPEKCCPLAGSWISVDREVLRLRMPSVYSYLSFRIIDTIGFYEMVKRWSTAEKWAEKERDVENVMHEKCQSNPNGRGPHRALDNIERSIETLKLFKTCLATF